MKIFLGVFLVMLLGSSPSWAVLGEYENSVATDQQHMHAQLRGITHAAYSVQQLTSPDGKTIKEYVAPSGKVFGVSWQGSAMPDLQQLLGSYFQQLQQASRSRKKHGGPFVVRTKDFVLVSGGHMRWYHGAAYVPSLLPANVTAEVVR